MRGALLSTLIIPVQALAWLGRQGTRAIAALVFIGIVVPPIGNVLKPFVTEAIFLLLLVDNLGHPIRLNGVQLGASLAGKLSSELISIASRDGSGE